MRVEFATDALESYSQALTRLHDLNPFAAQHFAERGGRVRSWRGQIGR